MSPRLTRPTRRRLTGSVALTVGVSTVLLFNDAGGVSTPDAGDEVDDVRAAVTGSPATKIALDHLRSLAPRPEGHGLVAAAPPVELVVDSTARSEHAGVTHVYVQQRLNGIDVVGATANVAVTDAGLVAHDPNSLVAPAPDAAASLDAQLDGVDAAAAALVLLGTETTEPLVAIGGERGLERRQLVSDGGVTNGPIEARLVHLPTGKTLVLAWQVRVDLLAGDHLLITVAADDGRELRRESYTISHRFVPATDDEASSHDRADGADDGHERADVFESRALPAAPGSFVGVADGSSYRAYALPIEAPAFGSSSLVTTPADPAASPFGWHDADGATGAESTLTTGNNVDAYLDQDANNVADTGSRPDGGTGLDFDVVHDDTSAPDDGTNPQADVINLFYANNWAHDFFHAYGFDEASGNFQENNYGNGGAGGDRVRAEGLDGYGLPTPNANNANFSTPPDGLDGRMQMYAFTLSNPHRSSSFDNGVILHEYGHGWSVRLTGGRNNVGCLNNVEQMGEGWSDYAALIATMRSGDAGTDARGIGAWVIGQNANGGGIRAHPYSTDMGIDPRTYGEIRTSSIPHGLGSTWAAMLWEMTWALVDAHGFDPDVVHGTGGNNIAMQLVSDGLKLQPCSPGFVDGRDAILEADRLGNAGANECLIWGAFAKRGLGWGADQGSSSSRSDGIESFDVPPHCPIGLTVEGPDGVSDLGDVVEIALIAEHHGLDPEPDVVLDAEVATGLAVVSGSASCDTAATVSETSNTVSFELGTLAAGADVRCTYDAEVVGAGLDADTLLSAGFEGDLTPFGASHVKGPLDWARDTTESVTGSASARATNPSTFDAGVVDDGSDQLLATFDDVPIDPCSTLGFVHRFDTEVNYDGGVVEVRSGTEPWTDLGPAMTSGGYPTTIASATTTDSAITGQPAFSGDSGGFGTTTIDLADFAGADVDLRFRYVSDFSVGSSGWWIDDVEIARDAGSSHTASITTGSGNDDTVTRCVLLDDGISTPGTTAAPTTAAPTTAAPTTAAPTTAAPTTTTPPPSTTTPPSGPVIGGGILRHTLEAADRLGRQS